MTSGVPWACRGHGPPEFTTRELVERSMARTPCFRCDQPFAGDAHNVYLSYFDGDESAKMRYVCCKGCVEDMFGEWLGRALHRGPDNRWHDPELDETLASILRASTAAPVGVRWQKVG